MSTSSGGTGARSEAMLALADTGATLTVMPGDLLDRLGVQRLRRVFLVLAGGRRAQRDVGEALVAVNGDSVPGRVVFGESGDAVLLGLTVLEQLGLAVDPVQRRLVPADFLLYGGRGSPVPSMTSTSSRAMSCVSSTSFSGLAR